MTTVLQSIGAFVVALAILITFHEFGHFWVARRCGVKILRFSVGFGKPLWKRRFGADASEFVIAALPLGGYVKMLDEREGHVDPAQAPRAFNRQPLWKRFLIVAAGPAFNFLFAIAVYWIIYLAGITGLKPVIEDVRPGSVAAEAGLRQGDLIVSVAGEATPIWMTVSDVVVESIVSGQRVPLVARGEDGRERLLELDLARLSIDDLAEGRMLRTIGVTPRRPVIPPVLDVVNSGGAAEAAGFRPGDRIIAIDGVSVRDWVEVVERVQASPGRRLAIEVSRPGAGLLNLEVVPAAKAGPDGKAIGFINAGAVEPVNVDLLGVERYGVFAALGQSLERTLETSVLTLRLLGKMIVGQASVKNLSGPISIAQYAGESADVGLVAFLTFLGLVSVSLGVLNLLPIPILDGGHLMYYLIELLKGSPVSDNAQVIGQQLGLAVLLGLMGLAFYNDILRLLG